MREITKDFIEMKTGFYPTEEDRYVKNIDGCVGYLLDNDMSEKEIFNILNEYNTLDIQAKDLPEHLWNNSLLEKNKFYFHDKLRIISKPPKWDPVTKIETMEPYHLEMKIKFTIEDLLEYYYSSTLIPVELRDEAKDKGALEYLIKKYKVMKAEPIDFILFMIDKSKYGEEKILNVFDLQKYEHEVYRMFECIFENKTINKKIIWREK